MSGVDIEVDWSDLGRLQTMLGAASNTAQREMPDILDDVCDVMVADMKQNAPVDRGEYRDDIGVKERSGNAQVRSRTLGSHTDQAFYQELGTSEMAPQPTIMPAARSGVDELERRMGELGEPW